MKFLGDINTDHQLTLAAKLELIEGIIMMQQVRWKRMKFFHNCPNIKMGTKHFFIKREIELMRSQKQRLENLRQSIYS